MNNLISTCYVIKDKSVGFENVIYLQESDHDPETEELHIFPQVFRAKEFLGFWHGFSSKVTIVGHKSMERMKLERAAGD